MNYYYGFVIYFIVGFLFFLDFNDKVKFETGRNVCDQIALQMNVTPTMFFKLKVIVCVLFFYPLIFIVKILQNK